jgi:hypothetical protein
MLNQIKQLTAMSTRKKLGEAQEMGQHDEVIYKKNLEKINLFYAEIPFIPQMQYKNWTPKAPIFA